MDPHRRGHPLLPYVRVSADAYHAQGLDDCARTRQAAGSEQHRGRARRACSGGQELGPVRPVGPPHLTLQQWGRACVVDDALLHLKVMPSVHSVQQSWVRAHESIEARSFVPAWGINRSPAATEEATASGAFPVSTQVMEMSSPRRMAAGGVNHAASVDGAFARPQTVIAHTGESAPGTTRSSTTSWPIDWRSGIAVHRPLARPAATPSRTGSALTRSSCSVGVRLRMARRPNLFRRRNLRRQGPDTQPLGVLCRHGHYVNGLHIVLLPTASRRSPSGEA